MIIKNIISLSIIWFATSFSFVKAQDTTSFSYKSKANKVILKHYSFNQLQELKAIDSVKFNTIHYYYKNSFIINTIPCTDCIAFDLSDFDVTWVEKLRKKSNRVEYTFDKYGFKVILLSIDELVYKMPIHLQ